MEAGKVEKNVSISIIILERDERPKMANVGVLDTKESRTHVGTQSTGIVSLQWTAANSLVTRTPALSWTV